MFQTEAHKYKFQVQGEQSYGYVLTTTSHGARAGMVDSLKKEEGHILL